MIKELFLAIILGGVLGFGFTGGYLTLHQKNQPPKPVIITEPTIIPTPTTTTENEINNLNDKLNIISPEDNLLVSQSNIEITGSTISNSQIVINTSTETFTGQSNQDGLFNIPIELEAGLNILKISSIDPLGNQLDTEINITYSTAKI